MTHRRLFRAHAVIGFACARDTLLTDGRGATTPGRCCGECTAVPSRTASVSVIPQDWTSGSGHAVAHHQTAKTPVPRPRPPATTTPAGRDPTSGRPALHRKNADLTEAGIVRTLHDPTVAQAACSPSPRNTCLYRTPTQS